MGNLENLVDPEETHAGTVRECKLHTGKHWTNETPNCGLLKLIGMIHGWLYFINGTMLQIATPENNTLLTGFAGFIIKV